LFINSELFVVVVVGTKQYIYIFVPYNNKYLY